MLTEGSATRVVAERPEAQSSSEGEWVKVDIGRRSFEVTETYTAVDIGQKLSGKATVAWHVEDPGSFAEAYLPLAEFEREYLEPLVSLSLYDALLELERRILSEGEAIGSQQAMGFLQEELGRQMGAERVFDEPATAYFGFVVDNVELMFERTEL